MTDRIFLDGIVIFPSHNKVQCNGIETRLEPKIMLVLCYLIERAGEPQSREKIAECVAPNSVTGLDVVTRAIFEIRKVLKDNAKSPKFIETIPRKGYCFIGELRNDVVAETCEDITTELANKEQNQSNISFFSLNSKLNAAIICSIFVCVLMYLLFRLDNVDENFAIKKTLNADDKLQLQLLTNGEENLSEPSLSPDGHKALLVIHQDKNQFQSTLVLLDVTTREREVLVTATSRIISPTWSEGGEKVYFGRCDAGKCSIEEYDLKNKTVNIVYQLSQQLISFDMQTETNLVAISYIQQNKRIVSIVSITGEVVSQNIDKSGLLSIGKPKFSASGRLIYMVGYLSNRAKDLFYFDIESGKMEKIDHEFELIYDITASNQDDLWIAARKHGNAAIWHFNKEKRSFTQKVGGRLGEFYSKISVSKDDNLLLYSGLRRNLDIKTLSKTPRKMIPDERLNANLIDINGIFISSTMEILFASNRSGSYEIWKASMGGVEKMTNLRANLINRPVLSKNQDKIAFITATGIENKLVIVDLESRDIIATHDIPAQSFALSWSNTDEQIFISAIKEQQYQIQTLDLVDGKLKTISLNAGLIAHQSANGEFYYADLVSKSLMSRSENGEVSLVYSLPAGLRSLMPHQARIIANSLYFVADDGESKSLVSVELGSSTLKEHFDIPYQSYVTQISLTDSREDSEPEPFVIYDKLIKDSAELVLVENLH